MTRIRVLLWIPEGLYRAVVLDALRPATDLVVLDAGPLDGWPAGQRADALRATMERVRPDVVIVPTPDAEMRRLVGEDTDYAAVFVSTDGRTALAYDRDVSADSLVRLIRSVAACAPRH